MDRSYEVTIQLTPQTAEALGLRDVIEKGLGYLNDPEWFTVAEAASILKVTKQTIHNWKDAGDLEYVRHGRLIRIPARAIKARHST